MPNFGVIVKKKYALQRAVRHIFITGSGKRDSNSRPRPWQGRALPTELFSRIGFVAVGADGFEPPKS